MKPDNVNLQPILDLFSNIAFYEIVDATTGNAVTYYRYLALIPSVQVDTQEEYCCDRPFGMNLVLRPTSPYALLEDRDEYCFEDLDLLDIASRRVSGFEDAPGLAGNLFERMLIVGQAQGLIEHFGMDDVEWEESPLADAGWFIVPNGERLNDVFATCRRVYMPEPPTQNKPSLVPNAYAPQSMDTMLWSQLLNLLTLQRFAPIHSPFARPSSRRRRFYIHAEPLDPAQPFQSIDQMLNRLDCMYELGAEFGKLATPLQLDGKRQAWLALQFPMEQTETMNAMATNWNAPGAFIACPIPTTPIQPPVATLYIPFNNPKHAAQLPGVLPPVRYS